MTNVPCAILNKQMGSLKSNYRSLHNAWFPGNLPTSREACENTVSRCGSRNKVALQVERIKKNLLAVHNNNRATVALAYRFVYLWSITFSKSSVCSLHVIFKAVSSEKML